MNSTKRLVLSMLPKWIALAIILGLVVLNFAEGQELDYYVDSEFELFPIPPELVPYQIVPLDPVPDCRLEMGIELIFPQSIVNLPGPQKDETLEIIYKRVN